VSRKKKEKKEKRKEKVLRLLCLGHQALADAWSRIRNGRKNAKQSARKKRLGGLRKRQR